MKFDNSNPEVVCGQLFGRLPRFFKLKELRTLGAVAISLLSACAKHEAPPPPPQQVGVVTVQPQSIALIKSEVGRLAPFLSANVTARVSGVLIKRDYKEGSEVKVGQVLFEIDPVYYQAQLNAALGTLGEDQATYENDRLNADRYHKLLPVGSVSQQTVDNTDAAVRTDEAKIKADKALVDTARVNLAYTRVTSPIAGIASQQQYTVGALVGNSTADAGSGGTLLTTVNQVDPLYVDFTISAADLITLRDANDRGTLTLADNEQTSVAITLPNGRQYAQAGALDFSDVNVNATNGAVNLRAKVPNEKHTLLPGMYVTLKVTMGEQHDVFLIPQASLQRDSSGAYAMVVDGSNKATRKNISAVDNAGSDWIVTAGLAAGDKVIVSGIQSVHEGAEVKSTAWQPPDDKESQGKPDASSAPGKSPNQAH